MSLIDALSGAMAPFGAFGTIVIIVYIALKTYNDIQAQKSKSRAEDGDSAQKFTVAAQTLVDLYMKRLTEVEQELTNQLAEIRGLTQRQGNLQLLFDQAVKDINHLKAGITILTDQLEKAGIIPMFRM